jgi:hypothetical protein
MGILYAFARMESPTMASSPASEEVSPEIAAGKVFEFVNLRISAALCLALAIFVAADAVMLQASWFTPVVGSATG